MNALIERISQIQDLKGQSILIVKLDRAAEKNGFFVDAIKLDAERNSVPLNAFGYGELSTPDGKKSKTPDRK